jgi:hypothetical protein
MSPFPFPGTSWKV